MASAQSMGKGVQSGMQSMGKSVQTMSKGLQNMLGKVNMQEKVHNILSRKQQGKDRKDPRTGHVYKPCDQSVPPIDLSTPPSTPSSGENIYSDIDQL